MLRGSHHNPPRAAESRERKSAIGRMLRRPSSTRSAQIIARYANDHHDIGRIAIVLMTIESQIPIASHREPRRFAGRLALFYGTLFGLTGTYLPFFPVWLKAVGIDASWIGIITAVPSVTRFTVLPVVTGLSERRQSLRGAM